MKSILLVEGIDDLHAITHIMKRCDVKKSFEIKENNGIDNLLDNIPVFIKSGSSILGIVIDADENITNRWKAIKSKLNSIGYDMSSTPDRNGTILKQKDKVVIGIWIMPNNNSNGMLEDFINSSFAAA